jgi:hypothetical protein
MASKHGHLEIVQVLLGAGVDQHSPRINSALTAASSNGHAEIVQVLLDAGVDQHSPRYINNALAAASSNGHADIVQVLLDAGADKDSRLFASIGPPTDGPTALRLASVAGHLDVVRVLLGAGADTEARDRTHSKTALMGASEYGHTEIVRALLSAGADKQVKQFSGQCGKTALQIAIFAQKYTGRRLGEIIALLGGGGGSGSSGGAAAAAANDDLALERIPAHIKKPPTANRHFSTGCGSQGYTVWSSDREYFHDSDPIVFDSSWRTAAEANARARYRFVHGNPWGVGEDDLGDISESMRNGLLHMRTSPPDSSTWSTGVVSDRGYTGAGPGTESD